MTWSFGCDTCVVTQLGTGWPLIVAQSVRSPVCVYLTTTVKLAESCRPPCASSAVSWQVTTWPTAEQAGEEPAATNVSPAGSVSVKVVAGDGPSPMLLATRV